MHYTRNLRHGTTDAPALLTAEERFWPKVERRGPRQCWLWIGALRANGRGNFWDGTAYVAPYRYSYVLHIGPIPKDLTIDHLCFEPRCVNPAHLEAVTQAENNRRTTGRR